MGDDPRKSGPIVIRGVSYATQSDAARALGVSPATISLAKTRGRLDAVGLGVKSGAPAKPTKIRGMMFLSREAAAEYLGVQPGDITAYLRVFDRAGHACQRNYKDASRPAPEPQRDPDLPPLGVMRFSDDGTRVQCHECGRWMRALNTHMHTHDLDATSYKERFGLPRTASLWPPAVKAKQREAALARGQGEIGKANIPPAKGRPAGQEARLGVRIAASQARKGIYTRGGNKTRRSVNDATD